MIKSLALLLLLIAIDRAAHAGAIDRDQVQEYYRLKNEAELKIADTAYGEALALYKQAFSCKFPNPRDLYNAFVVAYKLKDTAACKTYYSTLMELGQDKEEFEQLPFVAAVKDDMFYLRDIAWSEDYHRFKYMMSGRPAVARMLDSLLAVGEFYRKYYARDTFFRHDRQAIRYFCNYVKQHGFPGFEQAGIRQGQESIPYNDGSLQLVRWHMQESNPAYRSSARVLDSILYNAVLDGNYDPGDYALSADQQDDGYYEQLQPAGEMLSDEGPDFSKLDIAAINRRRAQLYLEPLEDYIRKWKFQLTDNNFYFFGPSVVVNNRKTIKKMLRDEAGAE